MLNLLVRYKILTNRGTSGGVTLSTGNYVNIYWDDVAESIEAQKFDDGTDTSGTIIAAGPDLGARDIDHKVISGLVIDPLGFPSNYVEYRYCDGTTLNGFFAVSTYPYVGTYSSAGHASCDISVVCDLQIGDDFTTVNATDSETADGEAHVTASSSNGTIKYEIDNPQFDYSTEGQTTGDFTGLFSGVHTITAKDAVGCFDQVEITVGLHIFYNPLYRVEYTDHNGIETRIDILERGYLGEVSEIKAYGDDPFFLKYNADGNLNKFKSIIPSEARLSIASETNFQFEGLFTQDDRKYQLRYYKEIGDPVEILNDTAFNTNWTNQGGAGDPWTLGATDLSVTIDQAESERVRRSLVFSEGVTYSINITGTLDNGNGANIIVYLGGSQAVDFGLVNSLTFDLTLDVLAASDYTYLEIYASTIGLDIDIVTISDIIVSEYQLLEKWRGFLLTDNYSESYIAPPYAVNIVATDGLADLKDYEFIDSDDKKYREDTITLKAITDILAKTDLGINIQCGVNRYEVDMDQGDDDDPLNQCKFDPNTFYQGTTVEDCSTVLEEILKPFAARILQRNGKWFITSIEEHVSTIDYREFDSLGAFIESGTIDDLVNIDTPMVEVRSAFRDRAQTLEKVPAYGTMYFEYDLIKNESLVKSYGFEEEDVYIDSLGITKFNDWNVGIANAPGVTIGIKETKSLQGDWNFYLKGIEGTLVGGSGGTWTPQLGKRLVLTQKTFPIEYDGTDVFELSFDYTLLMFFAGYLDFPHWVRIKWQLKVGSYYFIDGVGWDDTPSQTYNSIYVESFEKNQNFKIRANFRDISDAVTENVILEFVFEGRNGHDFIVTSGAGYDNLRAIVTADLPIGYKVKGYDNTTGDEGFYYYTLEFGTDSESTPDKVRPDDYNVVTNTKFWQLEVGDEPAAKNVTYIYFDNVILLHYPNGTETPKSITIEKSNNSNIKLNFEEKYLLNDIDIDNINNSERTYRNFFKFLDGTPTQVWQRTYRDGQGKLLDLLSDDFANQYNNRTDKLTGSFISDVEVLPTSCMVEVNNNDKKFIYMGYELNDKKASITFDMLEIIDVVTDPESPSIDAGFSLGFSLGFRS